MVIGMKMLTGEEVIAEVVVQTDESIEFRNPLAAVLQRGQNGQPQIGFMPYMAFAKGNIVIKKDKIIAIVELDDDIKNQYNNIFGTGILTPKNQLITG